MTTSDKIQIMQAFVEGKTVEVKTRTLPESQYGTLASDRDPLWNWESFDYRIKPEEIQVWWGPNGERMFHRGEDHLLPSGYNLKTFVEKV